MWAKYLTIFFSKNREGKIQKWCDLQVASCKYSSTVVWFPCAQHRPLQAHATCRS